MPSLSSVKDRAALKPRRDPYWSKISKGCYLGFRKMTSNSTGVWSARFLDEVAGKQQHNALGDYSALPDNQRHDAARRDAQAWFDHLGKGGSAKVFSVAEVCANYVDHLRQAKKGTRTINETQARFNTFVLSDKRFAGTEIGKLTPAHLQKWRRDVQARPTTSGANRGNLRSDSSMNRDMTSLRAALNLALNDGLVTSDFAWRKSLLPISNADHRREAYLSLEQRRAWIGRANDDLAEFLRGMSLIPLRPGALAALTAASMDTRLNTVTIGKDKAGKDRKIALPDLTAEFFAANCKNKSPSDPLLVRSNGKAWDKDAWKYPIKEAALAAGLPDDVTCYTMRHSVITDLIHGGLDTLTVAQLAGTSVLMIEKHYGHLTREHAREALARLVL